MQPVEPAPRSLERQRLRRRHARWWLLLILVSLTGVLIGWFLFGWVLFPRSQGIADLRDLDPNAKIEYVTQVVDAWTSDQDIAKARDRLRGLDQGELLSILRVLAAEGRASGASFNPTQVQAFAVLVGLPMETKVAGVTSAPTSSSVPSIAPNTPLRLAIAADVSPAIKSALIEWAKSQNAVVVAPVESADVIVDGISAPGAVVLAERAFVVVDWFPSLRTGITSAELRGLWQGKSTRDGVGTLLATDEAASTLTHLFGQPASTLQTVPVGTIVSRLWTDPKALGILSFDQLAPKVIALPLDGLNVLNHDLSREQYPLIGRTYVHGEEKTVLRLVADLRPKIPLTNRDPARITTLIMTGTTAITRTAAYKIEQKRDPALPARVVGPVLAAADITHISNEISFVDNCQPVLSTMTFCSKPSYIAAFKLAGVKIVGLTGNHLVDYGVQPFLKTLDTYDAAGLRYYGGGRNAAEAGKTLFLQDHGNRLAFLGANSFGPQYDWATADRPGSNRFDAAGLKKSIAAARGQADVVFLELQAEETYSYQPSQNNQIQFRGMLSAGADVVTGVQAHQPQAIEFSADGSRLILYGLGNLFFDQMFEIGVRQGIVARHTIYAGHLIQTELLTTLLEDSVQPRWTTPAERNQLLNSVFGASAFKRP